MAQIQVVLSLSSDNKKDMALLALISGHEQVKVRGEVKSDIAADIVQVVDKEVSITAPANQVKEVVTSPTVAAVEESTTGQAPVVAEVATTSSAEAPVTEEAELSSMTAAQLRAYAEPKISKHKEAIKEKLTELGANNFSSLDASKYTEFTKFLDGLK